MSTDAPWDAPGAKELDDTTLARWMEAKISDPQVGWRLMFEIGIMFAVPPWRLSLLHVLAALASCAGWRPGDETDELRLEGGAYDVVTAHGRRAGQQGRGNLPVARINAGGGQRRDRGGGRVTHITQGPDSVAVTVEGSDGHTAKACTLAIPSSVVRKLQISPALSDRKLKHLAEKHIGQGFKVYTIASNVPAGAWGIGMAFIQCFLPDRQLDDGTWLPMGLAPIASAWSHPTSRDHAEAALRCYFPEANVIDCDGHDWVADPIFDGAWRLDPPGMTSEGPRVMSEPEGRLFMAGSDFDDSLWRISIEGAVHSAHRAAGQVLAALLGLDNSLSQPPHAAPTGY